MRALADIIVRSADLSEPTGWRLAPEGLEHDATGYFIERGALAARRADGHWEWPLHMAEKAWCAPRAFREAFLAALVAFGVEADAGLAATFALAQGARGGRVADPARDRFVQLAEAWPVAKPARGRRPPERSRVAPPAVEPPRRPTLSARA